MRYPSPRGPRASSGRTRCSRACRPRRGRPRGAAPRPPQGSTQLHTGSPPRQIDSRQLQGQPSCAYTGFCWYVMLDAAHGESAALTPVRGLEIQNQSGMFTFQFKRKLILKLNFVRSVSQGVYQPFLWPEKAKGGQFLGLLPSLRPWAHPRLFTYVNLKLNLFKYLDILNSN